MAIYELHGLNDIAVGIAVCFAGELSHRLDVDRAIDLLCDFKSVHEATQRRSARSIEEQIDLSREHVVFLVRDRVELKHQLDEIRASTSWRLTAPMRAI